MTEQVSLFSILPNADNYEQLRRQALKSKRIRYKNATYTKHYEEDTHTDGSQTDSINTWGSMNRIYTELANRFPYPLAFETDRQKDIKQLDENTYCIDTGMIRTYKVCYQKGKYTHKGDDGITKEYDGEEFFYNYAEVIGTEDLGIQERLFIHSELINYLDEGYTIEKLNMWLDSLVNMFKQGWTASLYITLLLNMRCDDVGILQTI